MKHASILNSKGITWDKALFSFRFVNEEESLIFARPGKIECIEAAKIGPDLRLVKESRV